MIVKSKPWPALMYPIVGLGKAISLFLNLSSPSFGLEEWMIGNAALGEGALMMASNLEWFVGGTAPPSQSMSSGRKSSKVPTGTSSVKFFFSFFTPDPPGRTFVCVSSSNTNVSQLPAPAVPISSSFNLFPPRVK